MEQQTPKFRFRLNLFDAIILVLALAVGAFLLWSALKPAPAAGTDSPAAATVRYTVRFQRWIEGTGTLIERGDMLVDNIKNYNLGTVLSTEIVPAVSLQLDHNKKGFFLATIPSYEDILVTVESPCSITKEAIMLGGSYPLRVGGYAYIKGEGYMASGPIVSIEREVQP